MNRLRLLLEFQETLADHKISPKAHEILNKTKLVLLLGPTSSGRNTIISELMKRNKYYYIISDTTRQPRVNNSVIEQNGVEYWFRTEEEMLKDLQRGLFLEAEIIHGQQVSGISIRELQRANEEKKIAIDEVDILGVHTIIQAKPDAIAILVLPPSYKEWQNRLKQRGHMSSAEQKRRMQTAVRIFEDALTQPFYTFVVNTNLLETSNIIDTFVKTSKIPNQQGIKELIEQLLDKTKHDFML